MAKVETRVLVEAFKVTEMVNDAILGTESLGFRWVKLGEQAPPGLRYARPTQAECRAFGEPTGIKTFRVR